MPATHPSAKERARRAVDALPENASLEDVIAKLVVMYKVERGLEEARKGEGLMTQAEVETYFAERRAARARA